MVRFICLETCKNRDQRGEKNKLKCIIIFNPNYALDFIRKEIWQNSSEAHEQRKKLISGISI